jgi:D-sedoheptulose 7-phosphate isomerase
MSLNDNVPLMTALSNDFGYHRVFTEQLMNLIRPGDVLVVISGSGNSPNVLRAIDYARDQCAQVVGLLGFSGGRAADLCDTAVMVDSEDYGVIEDAHLILNHILVEYFRDRLSRERPTHV